MAKHVVLISFVLSFITNVYSENIGITYKYYKIPDYFFEDVFENYTNAPNNGISFYYSTPIFKHFNLLISYEYSTLKLPPGNFRLRGSPPEETVFLDIDLKQSTFALEISFFTKIYKNLSIAIGGGAGIAVLSGSAVAKEVLYGCEEPVEKCSHFENVAVRDLGLSDTALPVFSLGLKIDYKLLKKLHIYLKGGFFNLPYLGCGISFSP